MKSKFEFWLKNDEEQAFILLPVTPSSYRVAHGQKIEVIQATAIGDLNIAGYREPLTISIESFFPLEESEYDFLNRVTFPVTHPIVYVQKIKEWIENKKVIRFIITDNIAVRLNAQFYIESIQYGEDSESNGDINYTLTMREFIPMTTAKVTSGTKAENAAREVEKPPQKPKSHTVVKGDTLSGISRKYYGTPNRYMDIYNANKNVIGKNPNLIFPGQQLAIP